MIRVVAAMSGGVDSSVAAALTVAAGYETIGVTLKLLPRGAGGFGCCGAPDDAADARRVCERIGIPHYVLNFDQLFEKAVIDPFVSSYLSRRTPNPCVECNRSVKFGALLRLAEAWGAAYVATGHYARIERKEGAAPRLLRAVDQGKDQTYFLHCLTRRELERVLFPLGDLRKAEVRERARALGLPTADKKESQEICFVPNRDYRAFLRARGGQSAAFEPGPIRDAAGKVRGRHKGLAHYTIGQRRGIGVAAPEPLYVTRLDADSNTLTVGTDREARSREFRVEHVSWTRGTPPAESAVGVRIRHRAGIVAAQWEPDGGGLAVRLSAPQRGVTPGQMAVFYDGEEVLGGGTIGGVL
ncbi:MAG: tRNA 2-thiouridine(34) synthase MnmA [Elusimicrobiota bacterium]